MLLINYLILMRNSPLPRWEGWLRPLLLKRFRSAPVSEEGYGAVPLHSGQYSGQYNGQQSGQILASTRPVQWPVQWPTCGQYNGKYTRQWEVQWPVQ